VQRFSARIPLLKILESITVMILDRFDHKIIVIQACIRHAWDGHTRRDQAPADCQLWLPVKQW
jgi:hypothetical protein